MTRNKQLDIKKRAFWDVLPKPIIIMFAILGVISIFVGVYILGIKKSFDIDMAVSETISWTDDVATFKTKGTNNGDGYVSAKDGTELNAEVLYVWTKSKPKLVGTGASSYFCSSTSYGCKIKYYFSTGTNDEYWSVFIDASEALATMSAEEIDAYETQIIKTFNGNGFNPVIDHSATAVSAVTTAVAASAASDSDGVFEIGNL